MCRDAVIFDLDGTLIDSRPAIFASLRHVEQGFCLDPCVDLDWALGPPLADIMRRLLNSADPARISQAMSLYRAHHATVCLTHAKVYEGIREMLDTVRCRLFVGTSKLESVARRTLDHFELAGDFEAVCGSQEDGRLADKADIIAHLLDRYSLVRQATVVVGDREHDVIGARASGVRCVGVLWGYGTRQELEAAERLCSAPSELAAVLRGLL